MSSPNTDPMTSSDLGAAVRALIDQQKAALNEIKALDEGREQMAMTLGELLDSFYHVGVPKVGLF